MHGSGYPLRFPLKHAWKQLVSKYCGSWIKFTEFKLHALPFLSSISLWSCWVDVIIQIFIISFLFVTITIHIFCCMILQGLKCTQSHDHHHNQDTEQLDHPQTLSGPRSQTSTISNSQTPYISDFCSYHFASSRMAQKWNCEWHIGSWVCFLSLSTWIWGSST